MNSSKDHSDDQSIVHSYLTLRKIIGFMGMALPFVLWIGGYLIFDLQIQPSMSEYYYTPMRGIFVGFLFAIGAFFFAFRGHDRRDAIAGKIVTLCAFLVALFPTVNCQAPNTLWFHKLHIGSAAVLLLTLAYIAYFLFTETHGHKPPTPQKLKRNKIYRVCAGTILLAVIAAGIYAYTFDKCQPGIIGPPIIFTLEAISLVAFGIAWAVKGEVILADS